MTAVEDGWTDRQMELVDAACLRHLPPAAIVKKLGVAERVYYKIKAAAKLDFYDEQWRALQDAAAAQDERRIST
jgi:hypothetical protein